MLEVPLKSCHTQMIFHKRVAKCMHCNLEFVNTLTDPIAYVDVDLYPNVHVILKVTQRDI
jgi:hypothetical protein